MIQRGSKITLAGVGGVKKHSCWLVDFWNNAAADWRILLLNDFCYSFENLKLNGVCHKNDAADWVTEPEKKTTDWRIQEVTILKKNTDADWWKRITATW